MTTPRALLTVALAAVLLGSGGVVATAVAGGDAAPEEDPLGADSIVVTVDVMENGSAEWAIQYKYRLDTPNRTRGFERLRQRIAAREDEYVATVREDVQRTVRAAANETGRSMAVEDVDVASRRQTIPQDYGVVVHRFTWRGFADVNGGTIRVGDAIRGFWLRPDTRLTVAWPAGYEAAVIEPSPEERDGREVSWENPDFGTEEPQVVVEGRAERSWFPLAVPGLLLLGLVGTAAAALGRRDVVASDVVASVAPGLAATTGEGTNQQATPDGGDPSGRPESAAERHDEDGAESDRSTPDDEERTGATEDAPGPLTNEEQLRRVLKRNDGRVKQQRIAEACDWSDSKTSRVVRSLEDDGVVEVFRLGRENVVASTEVDSDAA